MKPILTCVLWLVAVVAWSNGYRDVAVFAGLAGLFLLVSRESGTNIGIDLGDGDGCSGGCGGD